MLNQIAEIFESAVTQTNLVEQYDGVVQRVTLNSQGQNGTIRETFPVSCTDPTACDRGNYRKAVPNQDLRGLAYVEQRGTPQIGPYEDWGYTATYPVRLVMWINAGKQSLDNCSDVITQAELNLFNCLRHEKTLTPSFSSQPITAVVRNLSLVQKNPGQIFQGYAYNDKQALYFWPYAYTAIDCDVIFSIPANCIAPVSETTPADCIEY